MVKKRRIILTAAMLIALGALCWLFLVPHEPVYRGISLSRWLREQQQHKSEYDGHAIEIHNQACAAIQAGGTDCLPTLLRLARSRESSFKRTLRRLERRIHLSPAVVSCRDDHEIAKFGFLVLGPAAKPAVPDIIRLLANKDPNIRATAALSLGFIGPAAGDAVPFLLKAVNDSYYEPRHAAIFALGALHLQPRLVVPELVKNLATVKSRPTDSEVLSIALSHYGSEARAAVPDLVKLASNHDLVIRDSAIYALWAIDPQAAAKIDTTSPGDESPVTRP